MRLVQYSVAEESIKLLCLVSSHGVVTDLVGLLVCSSRDHLHSLLSGFILAYYFAYHASMAALVGSRTPICSLSSRLS